MKSILSLFLFLTLALQVNACIELTEIKESEISKGEHPFKVERNNEFAVVTIQRHLVDKCGELKSSSAGSVEETGKRIEPEITYLAHEYFLFAHQLKQDREISAYFDCAKCKGTKRLFVLKLNK